MALFAPTRPNLQGQSGHLQDKAEAYEINGAASGKVAIKLGQYMYGNEVEIQFVARPMSMIWLPHFVLSQTQPHAYQTPGTYMQADIDVLQPPLNMP